MVIGNLLKDYRDKKNIDELKRVLGNNIHEEILSLEVLYHILGNQNINDDLIKVYLNQIKYFNKHLSNKEFIRKLQVVFKLTEALSIKPEVLEKIFSFYEPGIYEKSFSEFRTLVSLADSYGLDEFGVALAVKILEVHDEIEEDLNFLEDMKGKSYHSEYIDRLKPFVYYIPFNQIQETMSSPEFIEESSIELDDHVVYTAEEFSINRLKGFIEPYIYESTLDSETFSIFVEQVGKAIDTSFTKQEFEADREKILNNGYNPYR